jgi:hypothetical protein
MWGYQYTAKDAPLAFSGAIFSVLWIRTKLECTKYRESIVGLIDANAPAPKKRGPYKKEYISS